eukprot:TCONS_00029378-protein
MLNGAFQIVQIYDMMKSSWTSFHVIFNVRLFFMMASIFHLLLIGADRLFAVARPFQHNVVVTKRKLYWTLFLVWVLSFSGLGLFKIYDEYLSSKGPVTKPHKPPSRTRDSMILYQNISWRVENVSQYNTTQKSKKTDRMVNDTLYSLGSPFDIHKDGKESGRRADPPPSPTEEGGPPPPPPAHILKRITTKENILAYCLIAAAISLVIMYSAIIYFVQNAKQKHIRRKVSLLSVLVPACFIAFTLQYAVMSLSSDDKTFFLPNVLLLTNSAANSLLYFFKDICKRKDKRRKTPQNKCVAKVSKGETTKKPIDKKVTSSEHIELQVTSYSAPKDCIPKVQA